MDSQLLTALTAHVPEEMKAAMSYQALSAWCGTNIWPGSQAYFAKEAKEEYEHAWKFQEYVVRCGGAVLLPALPAFSTDGQTPLVSCYESALKLEVAVLAQIDALNAMANRVNDTDAQRFLSEFAQVGREQIRELTIAVAELKRAGSDMGALQAWDRERG